MTPYRFLHLKDNEEKGTEDVMIFGRLVENVPTKGIENKHNILGWIGCTGQASDRERALVLLYVLTEVKKLLMTFIVPIWYGALGKCACDDICRVFFPCSFVRFTSLDCS